MGTAGAFARPHQDCRTAREAMVQMAHRSSCCLASRPANMLGSDAWHGGFCNKTGGHINPLALSRGLARVVIELGGRIYRALAGDRLRAPWRSLGGHHGERTSFRPRAGAGEQRLYRRVLEIPGASRWPMRSCRCCPGRCRRSRLSDNRPAYHHPGRQAMSDTHGELYFARYDARNRLVTGGAVIGPGNKAERLKTHGGRTIATAVAADRATSVRLCLERLCRHDHGLPAAHPSARAGCLWLDRLQRPRCGADHPLGAELAKAVRGVPDNELALPFTEPVTIPAMAAAQSGAADAAALPAARRAQRSLRRQQRRIALAGEIAAGDRGQQRLR